MMFKPHGIHAADLRNPNEFVDVNLFLTGRDILTRIHQIRVDSTVEL